MDDKMTNSGMNRSVLYALCGFFLGISAPIGWTFLRLLLFWERGVSAWEQIVMGVVHSPRDIALYLYMGAGTALVLAIFGYFIGKTSEQVHERARRLDELNRAIAQQKEDFERRFKDLDYGIKNFHAINTHIQKSVKMEEVLGLAADGLHDVLNYDRVNIFMVNPERDQLKFVAGRGSEEDENAVGLPLPLDERAGALYKTVMENRLFLIDDIRRMPEEYHLKPPCDSYTLLRSRNFILCPIVLNNQVVGLFGVDNKVKRKNLDDTDVDTIKLFADQVSSALTKISLLEGVESLTRELEHTFQELLKYREDHAKANHSLRQSTNSTSEAIGDIADAGDVIREAVDSTRSAVGEISVSIEQVSQNLNQLTDFMDRSISAMTEISTTIRTVEENSVRSHGMSETVKEQAEKGVGAVTATLNGLKGIAEAVENAVGVIDRLSQKGEEVDSITGVITEITQKTNLLALNAAIIAAQAGEHGRSFAVVADEVRSLSQEAAYSTGAIAQIIEEIQAYTREAVDHIGITRALVQEGIEMGQGTESSLKQILQSSGVAMSMARDIRKATQEVARSVESVSRSIEDLGEMTSQVSLASKEQAQGTRSIVQSVEEVKSMVDDMVQATERQHRNIREIEAAVQMVSEMARRIFSEMVARQKSSRGVIEKLEQLKQGSGTGL